MIPNINLSDYFYDLPNDKIAFYPLENRDECKLISVNNIDKSINHHIFNELENLIPKNTSLFINSSKVIFARISAKKLSGGKAEIFLTSPISPSNEYTTALNQSSIVKWNCIIGGKNIHQNDTLISEINQQQIKFKIIQKNDNEGIVEFNPAELNLTVRELLNLFGQVPLPPYIRRENIETDKNNYQTVYANKEGSIAAPTAGLHFTEELISKLTANGFDIFELTLHVGLGTFKPINTDNIEDFDMHSERIIIRKTDILNLINCIIENKNILAVGTTSTRIIESLYWIGNKIYENPKIKINYDSEVFSQFYPYECKICISTVEALNSILNYLELNNLDDITIRTKLLIIPTYNFKIVNLMITNFHQPNSTLILLIAAFIGKQLWEKSYNLALESNYRFLSYGDAMLLINHYK